MTEDEKQPLKRFTEAQKDTKVLLSEAAAVVILAAAYKNRIWKDDGLFRRSRTIVLDDDKETTTGWVEFLATKKSSLAEKLEELKSLGDTDELEALHKLGERLQAAGGVAANALAQVRRFRMGDIPNPKEVTGRSVSGVLRLLRIEDSEGATLAEVHEVEFDSGFNLEDSDSADRLSTVIRKLPDSQTSAQ